MKVQLMLHSKNWAVIEGGSPLTLDAQAIPRVGEIVDINNAIHTAVGGITTFIVCDITWGNEDGHLTPYLKCHEWHDGDRRQELQEHGWA